MILFHKIHGKDFLVEVATSAPSNSEVEQMSKIFENKSKSLEGGSEKQDTFVEELKKLESKSGNDYMSSMAKEGRCEGDQKASFRYFGEFKVPRSYVPRKQGCRRTFHHVKNVALSCVGALESPLKCIENEFDSFLCSNPPGLRNSMI